MRIDCHTHIFPEQLPPLARTTGDDRWPTVNRNSDGSINVMVQGALYRRIAATAYAPAERLAEMDREQVDKHLLMATPITFTYWGDAQATLELCRFQNDFMAQFVAANPQRFIGFATVPLQEPKLAVEELRRARRELKLAGVELGATVRGLGLHLPELRPFFKAAMELDCPLFIHPLNEAWAWDERIKRWGMGLTNSMAMPHETAMSAGALLLSDLLIEYPDLRFCLAHGGGSLAAVLPRMGHQWEMRRGRGDAVTGVHPMELARKLWVDNLTYDYEACTLCRARFGGMVLGTDYPFDGRRERPPGIMFDQALERGVIAEAEVERIKHQEAMRYLFGR